MVIDAFDFHWLTGILEGEGTFLAGPPSNPGIPIVRVSMTDRDIVERVARLFDRAVVTLRRRREHHKTPFVTTIKGAPAVELMIAADRFMGVKRRAEIQRAILSRHDRRSHRSRRGSSINPAHQQSEILSPQHACDGTCDVSWLAGLLEGEGTFSTVRTHGRAYPVLKVSMCSEDIVSRASRLIGAPSVTVQQPEHEAWSVVYAAAISGSDGAHWMRRLRDHMGRRRTEAIDAALAAYHPIRLVDPPGSCTAPGCHEPHRGRGLCHKHYMMWSRDRAKGRVARIAPLR